MSDPPSWVVSKKGERSLVGSYLASLVQRILVLALAYDSRKSMNTYAPNQHGIWFWTSPVLAIICRGAKMGE